VEQDWSQHFLSAGKLKNNKDNIDTEIIDNIKKGNTSGFRFIIEKYKDVSFSLACSILHDEHEAEDALQEAFVKVYKNITKFRGQSAFSTWLYRIVVNTCFTAAKKLAKKNLLEENIAHYQGIEAYEDKTGLDGLMHEEQSVLIKKVLKSMKTDEALLLRLFYLSELDIKEIMNITGFKESKIKVTLHRARKNLLQELKKVAGNELIYIL